MDTGKTGTGIKVAEIRYKPKDILRNIKEQEEMTVKELYAIRMSILDELEKIIR